MAKYYIKSGEFRIIIDAPDVNTGLLKTAICARRHKATVGVLVSVSETGLCVGALNKIMSFLPFLRLAGVNLPAEDQLLQILSKIIKKPVQEFDIDFKRWYFEGDDNFNPPSLDLL